MTNLVLALCIAGCLTGTQHVPTPAIGTVADLPIKAPVGWKSEKQDGSTVLTPGDVPSGKIYVVMVTPITGKAGSLDEVYATGKKSVEEIGTFKPAHDPRQAASEGGWDYKFVLGTLEKGDRGLVAQVVGIKKGDEGGNIVVLSDSVETMEKYVDPLNAMLRGIGAKPAPVSKGSGTPDLQYNVPPGWTQTKVNGFPLLVKEKNEEYTKYRVSLLVFPTEPLSGSIREQFVGYWNSFITPNYETNIAPIPMMVRLKSGHACAFDGQWDAKAKDGSPTTVALYMIAHGGRAVPVMAIYSGPGAAWALDGRVEIEVGQFLDTARIPGASAEKVKLFSASTLAGYWTESGAEYATYVRSDGSYAGNATIATATYFDVKSDGTYDMTLMAVGAAGNIKEKNKGTWSVDDDEIVLSKGGRYTLLGGGKDAKTGRFLVIGPYSNTKARLKFTNPRGILQAKWLRAKE